MCGRFRRFYTLILAGLGLVVAAGCGEQKPDPEPQAVRAAVSQPKGTWLMYGTGSGLFDAETLAREMSVLSLQDSTYTLSFAVPGKLSYVESGIVDYVRDYDQMVFTVLSVTGVDWTGETPKKLVGVEEIVPWQRDPGLTYAMDWVREGELLSLSAPGFVPSFFKRMAATDGTAIDVERAGSAP